MDSAIPRSVLLGSTVFLDLAMLGVAFGGGWLLGLPWWHELEPTLRGAGTGTTAGLVLLAAIWVFVHAEGGPLPAVRAAFRRDLREVFQALSPLRVPDLLLISAGAGLAEEALFRGLAEAVGTHWLGAGPLVGAVAFGLAHPISRLYVAYTAVIGLMLSGLAASEGLFAAMVAHGVYDAVALVAGMRSGVLRPLSHPPGDGGQP